jgi:hypothetical protein
MKYEKWQIVIMLGIIIMGIVPVVAIACEYYFGVDAVTFIPIVIGGGGLYFFGLALSF